jgi:hypothetical protein
MRSYIQILVTLRQESRTLRTKIYMRFYAHFARNLLRVYLSQKVFDKRYREKRNTCFVSVQILLKIYGFNDTK